MTLQGRRKFVKKSKYENDGVLFPRGNNSFGIPRKTWYIAKYIRLSKEDGDDKDESNSVVSQDKILDDLIMDLAQSQKMNLQYMILTLMMAFQEQILIDLAFKNY